jgi:hypothetical protein
LQAKRHLRDVGFYHDRCVASVRIADVSLTFKGDRLSADLYSRGGLQRGMKRSGRWVMVAAAAALLSGCAWPYYGGYGYPYSPYYNYPYPYAYGGYYGNYYGYYGRPYYYGWPGYYYGPTIRFGLGFGYGHGYGYGHRH